jgi:arabinose-5-phosphate isomerase
MNFLKSALRLIEEEKQALNTLNHSLLHGFEELCSEILKSEGRIIVSGVGKSGIVARKISATLSSTGTPSMFIHPTEALHGDLGMIQSVDIFLAISYSGETEELLKLIPWLQKMGVSIASITGRADSALAAVSKHHLHINVSEEACPHRIVPTASSTATMVLGDALAVAIMEARGIGPIDLAKFHPGGSLGKKLQSQNSNPPA